MSRKRIIILLVFLSLFLPVCGDVLADPVVNANMQASAGIFDKIISNITDALGAFGQKAQEYGLYLLGTFMLINMVWRFGSLMFRGNSISDLFFEFVRTIMIYGFFLWFLKNLPELADDLLRGFSNFAQDMIGGTGGAVSNRGVSASACLDMGIECFTKLMESVQPPSIDGVGGTLVNCVTFVLAALTALIIGFVIIILWVYIAINIVLVTVSFYFIAYCGAFMLGFAGMEWTRNTALAYLNALLGAAVKFFGTFMIAGMFSKVARDCLDSFSQSGNGFQEGVLIPFVTLLVVSFIGFLLVDKLPNMLAAIISPATNGAGISIGGFAAATGMQTAAKSMAGAAVSLAGTAAKMAGAGAGLAGSKMKNVASQMGIDGAASAMDTAGSKARAAGVAMGSVLGGVMAATGHPGMRTGMKINQQMASSNIHEQLKQQGLEQGKSDAEAEKYADQQTDAFSRNAKNSAANYAKRGMSASAAATTAMREQCRSFDVSYGGPKSSHAIEGSNSSTEENSIKAGGGRQNFNGGGSSNEAPSADVGASQGMNNWARESVKNGDSSGAPENAYQNIKDVHKDPINEDPATDMNAQGPEHIG